MITSVLLGETNNVLAVLTLVQPRDNAGGRDPRLFDHPPSVCAVSACSDALLREAVNALGVPAKDCCPCRLAQCGRECLVGAEGCQIVGG